MKLLCINNSGYNGYLTKDKIYDGNLLYSEGTANNFYLIRNDLGYTETFLSFRFITIEDHRESKLNEILNV